LSRVDPDTFELPVSLRVRGSVADIYTAWVDPAIASEWLCDKMDGQWFAGQKVYWVFGDVWQEIRVLAVAENKCLTFLFNPYNGPHELTIQLEFRDLGGGEVGLALWARGFELSKEHVATALDMACGFENMFCRCKAWIEARVKLR